MTGRADPPRPPVLADVARLAGVSNQTVSRVVNGSPSLRPETRARVLGAIERLGYRPNFAARALVRGRSGAVGIIATGGVEHGPVSTHHSVDRAARKAGYVVSSVMLTDVTHTAFDGAVEHLLSLGVEAVVIIAGHDSALDIVRAQRAGLPFVIVEGDLSKAALSVGVDQAAGAVMATRHLLELGHREIAHVGGPLDWAEARARLEGWRSAMYAADVRPGEPIFGDWTARSGYAAGQRLARLREVSAVFVANDQMAIGLLAALHEAGRYIPGDLSVVGFDDIPEAEFTIPSLTTVRQDFDEVGRRAIEVVRAASMGQPSPTALLRPELIIRGSSRLLAPVAP